MKLDVAVNEVTLSNTGASGEFKIRNSAKAFKILSDGLYSNKKRAIIRELSCNALDSHVAAGKPDLPFEVHLPTMLEPWFSVRDFGTGLDDKQVMNIYTTYFESTKTDSNDFIGALGLGSKSPFSYTENFTVTAIKDGKKRIYSAYINENGVPCVTKMSEEKTKEDNGVEVKFSVTDRWDYDSFRHEAQAVFKWFKVLPNITGVKLELQKQKFTEMNIVPGVHTWNDHGSMAVMGNIAYPLHNVPEKNKHFGNLASLLDCGLVIEFDIGKLDFAASREELSFVPMTIRGIKEKLEELNANLAKHLAKSADAIKCEWARAQYLYEQSRTRLYSAAVQKYVADTKFELYDDTRYDKRKEFVYEVTALEKRKLSISAVRCSSTQGTKINEQSSYVNGNYVRTMNIPVDKDVVIVLNDLKTGCLSRAKYHYVNHNGGKYTSVFCISHSDPDLDVRQKEYDKIIKELHNPPVVVKASALEKPEKIKSSTRQGIMKLETSSTYGRSRSNSGYSWYPVASDFENDDTKTYYYVALSNYETQDLEGKYFNLFSIVDSMTHCGIKSLSNIEIYGVRKSVLKDIKPLDNWIWFEEKVKEEVAKVSDGDIESAVALNMFDRYYEAMYTNPAIAKLVGSDSKYSQFVSVFNNPQAKKAVKNGYTTDNVPSLVELCGKYGKTVKVEEIKNKVQASKDELKNRYPLLDHLRTAPEKLVADYIKLIDKTEKNND